jgi:hypothetical protein
MSAQIARIDAVFAQEVPDDTWKSGASAELRGAVTQALPTQSTLNSIECRKNLCKLVTTHATRADMQKFSGALLIGPSRTLPSHTWGAAVQNPETLSDSTVRLTTFLSRPGYDWNY